MKELTISLDPQSVTPLYEQIYQYVKEDIQSGRLACGVKLPSSRSLARYLEISRSTVELAYEQLLSEGYIETKPRKGVFVAQIDGVYQFRREEQPGTERQEEQKEKYRYDFSPSGIDLKSFPYAVWRKLSREVLLDDRAETFRLGDSQGEYGLRSAISSYLHQARGVRCRPEQIIVGAGNDYLLMLLINILGKDKKVAFETPTYKQAYRLFANLSQEVCTVPMDHSGMRTDLLEKSGAQVAYVMPSHQFPLGVVMPIRRRLELLKWADRGERYIIEDDYDSELRLGGKPIPTLQSIDVSDKVIYMNTFTKTLSSTVRISYMVLPASLTELFYKKLSFYSCTVSNFEQYTLARFMESGSFEKHINRLRNYYQNKRDAILEIFKTAPLDQYITIKEEDSGVHFMMKLKTDRTEMDMISDAKSKGIKLAPLSKYFVDQTSNMNFQNVYVMNYSSIDLEQLPLIFDALCQVLIK